MKKLIITIVAVLFFVVVPSVYAATDSATSKFTINVLPAFEATQIGQNYQNNVLDITISKSLAIRSNTKWDIQVQSLSYGFFNPSQCSVQGTIGLSNGQAGVGNNAQFIDLICIQEKSWSDAPDASFDIYYTTSDKLSI